MLISGLSPLKLRLQAKDNSVKKYCITDLERKGLYTWPKPVKSFPHRINILVHSKMLISPRISWGLSFSGWFRWCG